ncbi:histone-like nucleoid-structuring protein Lsr2 [Streptomyces sp. NPDC005732]|uniref:Lsr2 family DNA-binding protein n=1 Tax=Streptomyces sp. NPDC005732 TaxID=3157057 RepID=UPI00340308FF
MTVAALRALLDEIDHQGGPDAARHNRLHLPDIPAERTSDMDTITPAPRPSAGTPATMPVGQLLAWAAAHSDAKIRKAAGQARDALDTLRARHHADEQLKSIDEEAARLEERLAQLKEQKAAIAPSRKAPERGYEPADVRAWAAAEGIELPGRGRIPETVVADWRAAGAPTREQ